ncbi:hypothetical protein M3231_01050 [Neobacillus mesonae]|nr:hypothetical protein [Neobacillus mesonae]
MMSNYTEMQEHELSAAGCRGDFQAFEELVRRNGAQMYILALALGRKQEAGFRIMEQAISLTWQYRRKVKDEKNLPDAIYKQIGTIAAKEDGASEESGRLEQLEQGSEEGVWQSSKQMMSERSTLVERMLLRMSVEQRTVFLLTYAARLEKDQIVSFGLASEHLVEHRLNEAMDLVYKGAKEQKVDINEHFLLRHFQDEHERLLPASDTELAEVMQAGFAEAKAGKILKLIRKKRIIWGAVGCAILIFIIGVLSWGTLGYQEMKVFDQSYWSSTLKIGSLDSQRLEEGDYVSIGEVLPEQNGLRLFIDGAMQTSDGFMMWYRLENTQGRTAPNMDKVDLWNNGVVGGESYEDGSTRMNTERNRVYGKIEIAKNRSLEGFPLDHSQVHIAASVEENGQYRSAAFELAVPDFPEKPAKEINIDKSFTIQGQTFYIPKVTITTDRTIVSIEADSSNLVGIEQLREPTLDVVNRTDFGISGENKSKLDYSGSLEEWMFGSIYYDEFTELRLYINGIQGSVPSTIPFIKINTDTGEVVEAPDSFNGNVEISGTAEDSFFHIYFPQTDSLEYSISNQYTDALGNVYFTQGNQLINGGVSYKVTNFDYAQPLTFDLDSYQRHFYEDTEDVMEEQNHFNLTLVENLMP